MKKLIYLLLAVCLFTACSDDDDNNDNGNNNGNNQNKTSFVIYTRKPAHYLCKAYCYNDEGSSKIYDIEFIGSAPEIETFVDDGLDKMYITYQLLNSNTRFRVDTIFQLQQDVKNIFEISSTTKETKLE